MKLDTHRSTGSISRPRKHAGGPGHRARAAAQPKIFTQGLDRSAPAVGAQAIQDDRSGEATLDGKRCFVLVRNPPPRLIIVGAVHITQALAPMAPLAGYDVTVVDPRGAFATSERFPGVTLSQDWPDEAMEALKPDLRTAVVTLTHDPKLDDPALVGALRSPAFYIGALGQQEDPCGARSNA